MFTWQDIEIQVIVIRSLVKEWESREKAAGGNIIQKDVRDKQVTWFRIC